MASLTMTATFLRAARPSPPVNLRTTVEAKACVPATAVRRLEGKKESSSRRVVMLEAAAAAVLCVAGLVPGMAVAEEPKRGTPEFKKKYGPVCVTMPTARICHS